MVKEYYVNKKYITWKGSKIDKNWKGAWILDDLALLLNHKWLQLWSSNTDTCDW